MKILWIPHTGWHIPQRAHFFCRALAQHYEVHVTDWVADFSRPRDLFSRRYLQNFTYRRYEDERVHVHGIPRLAPALYSSRLRSINRRIFSHYIQRIINKNAIDVVIGCFLVPPPNAPRLILDVFDDNPAFWREFRSNSELANEIAQIEESWARKSDHIVVISSVLKEKLTHLLGSSVVSKISIVPNGVDSQRFISANGERVRKKLGIDSQKVVGFISGMGEFSGLLRYIDSIRHLARPDVTHLIVGDGILLGKAQQRVKEDNLNNVVFTGWVKPEEVADYFAALDVGVIPFDLADFTHSAFPIKLLEYLSCQIPVVSTKLEEVRRLKLPGVVLTDTDSQSLAKGIQMALATEILSPPDLTQYSPTILTRRYAAIIEGD